MKIKLCPFCRHYSFENEWHGKIVGHVAECSKAYIDRHLLGGYIKDDHTYVQKVKMPERRIGKGRRKVNDDRRKISRTLWYSETTHHTKSYAGFYINKHFEARPDRRRVLTNTRRGFAIRRKCDR